MLKTMTFRSMLVAVACALSIRAYAMADEPRKVDVPAGELTTALRQLAEATGVEFVYSVDDLKGVRTSGVSGEYTAEKAVTKLLEGTTLKLTAHESGALLIALPTNSAPKSSVAPPAEAASRENSERTSWLDRFRLAQADITQNSENQNSSSKSSKSSSAEEDSSKSQELPAPDESDKGIPELLVKGRRTVNADIVRTRNDPQPYVTFDTEDVKQSNAFTVGEFLKARLPMNTLLVAPGQSAGSTLGVQSQIDLRGLGTAQTLVLLDGRRLPSTSTTGTLIQPDINAIPVTAVERIEILPSTASGIYGGGATGGAINIITRKDFEGVEINTTYGNTFRDDYGTYRIAGTAGFSLEGGRTHVLLAASYAGSDALSVGDRDFLGRARELQFHNNSSAFYNLAIPPSSYLTNIKSQNGSNLVLTNGTPLNAPRTFVPAGYAGPASDGGAALVANAGSYNLDLPDTLLGTRPSLLNGPQTNAAIFNVRREFTERVEAFADFSWFDNKGETQFTVALPASTTLAVAAPNNPFTVPIVVSFPATGLASSPLRSENETLRGVGGVIVRLPGDWTAAVDYGWNRNRYHVFGNVFLVGDPDGTGPAPAETAALANGTLNVMRDLNAFPLDFTPYLLPTPNIILGPAVTLLHDATFRVSGPIVELPGGPLSVSGLFEWRKEKAEPAFQQRINAAGITTTTFYPTQTQTVLSYSGEARAPVISDRNAMPFARSLELQASVRHDDYETNSPNPAQPILPSLQSPPPALTYVTNKVSATTFTIGGRFMPNESIALRGSYATGFLAPAVGQLVTTTGTISTLALADPKRGGVSTPVGPFTSIAGGNPDLVPEKSKSWSIGGIFTPAFLPDFRVSLDFTHIKKTEEIRAPGQQTILNNETLYPGRVTRAPLTPADMQLGYTGGVITAIDVSLLNFSQSYVDAYDLQGDYNWRTMNAGDLRFHAVLTWQPHLARQPLPNGPFVESIGYNSAQLEWRGNGGITWTRGGWTVGWNAQYYHSYYAYTAGATATVIAAAVLNQGNNGRIQSQTYHDMFATYRFGDSPSFGRGILDRVEVSAGIQNVFDEIPPIVASTASVGNALAGYSFYGDPRLQRFTLSLRKSF